MMAKVCEHCGGPITRKMDRFIFERTRFCSKRCSALNRERSAAERFDDFWMGEPNSGCWLWMGSLNSKGYGMIRVLAKKTQAHRFSYERFVGPIAKGGAILHKCDVTACVNPRHLRLGTQALNIADRNAKGRTARGERHASAKLTLSQIQSIRACSKNQASMARSLGISVSTICSIRARRTWAHVP